MKKIKPNYYLFLHDNGEEAKSSHILNEDSSVCLFLLLVPPWILERGFRKVFESIWL